MTDNRDIDEILASLDALLREGDSHNDDIASEPEASIDDTDALEDVLETDIESINADVEELLGSNKISDDTADEAVHDESASRQESSISRVILTEDMMVENPQVSLPLAFNSEALNEDDVVVDESSASESLSLDDVIAGAVMQQDVVDDEPTVDESSNTETSEDSTNKHTESDQVMRLHKQEIEQLLTLVTEDISNHLQQILPKLMKESLHARLADMQHDIKEAPNKS